jgi:hypothetical protein
LTKITKPTSLQIGSPIAFLKSKHLEIYNSHQYWRFSFFGIRSTHKSSITIGLGFLEGSNISGIMLKLWHETIVNSRFHSWFFCSPIWLDLLSLDKTNSFGTKASIWNLTTKKNASTWNYLELATIKAWLKPKMQNA